MAGTLTISTLSDGTNSTSATNCIQGSAKAWVCYNGVGQAIRASYNVSSVTYTGTGNYTVNFTNALADTNYATIVNGTVDVVSGAFQYFAGMSASSGTPTSKTTTQITIASLNLSGSYVNSQQLSVAIFR
jgi:hypothetical protein